MRDFSWVYVPFCLRQMSSLCLRSTEDISVENVRSCGQYFEKDFYEIMRIHGQYNSFEKYLHMRNCWAQWWCCLFWHCGLPHQSSVSDRVAHDLDTIWICVNHVFGSWFPNVWGDFLDKICWKWWGPEIQVELRRRGVRRSELRFSLLNIWVKLLPPKHLSKAAPS